MTLQVYFQKRLRNATTLMDNLFSAIDVQKNTRNMKAVDMSEQRV